MYAVWLNLTSEAKTEVRIPLLTSSGCLQKRTLTFKGLKRVNNDWILMIGWTFPSRSWNSVESLVFQNSVSLKDIFPELKCTQSNVCIFRSSCVRAWRVTGISYAGFRLTQTFDPAMQTRWISMTDSQSLVADSQQMCVHPIKHLKTDALKIWANHELKFYPR